jgi:MFS transporter, SP family, xylose:H+ symportor
MNKTWNWSLTVALAGFLFGFDTVVISGANAPIKELWQTSAWFHGIFIMSMALWGTVLGSLAGGIPTKKFGRKNTLIAVGILYLVSALGSGLAPDPYSFSIFRFLGGVGVGASTVAAPTYISEISTAKSRGTLVALYQFNIVFGILIAFLSNYLLDGFTGANDWRWMLGVEAIPAAIYCLLIFGVPQSPRWLITVKKDKAGALAVLERILGNRAEAEKEVEEITLSTHQEGSNTRLFSGAFKRPLLLAFLLAFFNQLSGINFILYYAPVILENAGFASSDSLLSSIAIGGTNLAFTFVGLYLIDRMGRKSLMYIGSIGYIISLAMVAYGFKTEASAGFNLFFILTFIASHAVGQGAVIWVFISEIFPNSVRAAGGAWGTGTHWVFAALITMLGEVVIESFPGWTIFAFFAAFMVLQLLFTHFIMPETRGKSLEELQENMKNHG